MPQGTKAIVRCRRDAWGLAVGVAALLLCWLPVDAGRLSGFEESVFEAINGVPSIVPYVVVWAVMQLGSLLAVPLAAAAAVLANRPRLGAALALSGVTAYLGARLVKELADRGRPAAFLDDVTFRGAVPEGAGFASGHAAVAAALATAAWPWVGPWGRRLIVAGAAFVCVARVYVGAHLPLDVIGGSSLGLAAGCAARLVWVAVPAPAA